MSTSQQKLIKSGQQHVQAPLASHPRATAACSFVRPLPRWREANERRDSTPVCDPLMGMCAGGSAYRLPLNRTLSFGSANQGRRHVGGVDTSDAPLSIIKLIMILVFMTTGTTNVPPLLLKSHRFCLRCAERQKRCKQDYFLHSTQSLFILVIAQ